jgi:hypothetical protein
MERGGPRIIKADVHVITCRTLDSGDSTDKLPECNSRRPSASVSLSGLGTGG